MSVAATTGPIAVARMPPISFASASWVNRVREPNSSAIVTLSSENRPRTPMFSAMTMPSSRAGMLPLVISSSSGKASTIVSALSTDVDRSAAEPVAEQADDGDRDEPEQRAPDDRLRSATDLLTASAVAM